MIKKEIFFQTKIDFKSALVCKQAFRPMQLIYKIGGKIEIQNLDIIRRDYNTYSCSFRHYTTGTPI